jgi:CRP/FNR family transcriptional regulator, cyclic AMP receptor protein
MSKVYAALSRMVWFAELDPALGRTLADKGTLERPSAGRWLFGEGNMMDHAALIVAGAAGIYRSVAASRSVLVGIVGPGTLIGQVHSFRGELPYTAVARTDVEMVHFRRGLGDAGTHNGDIPSIFAGLLARQLATTLQRTADRTALPPLARVAAEIAYLIGQFGNDPVLTTQDELGEMVGLSRKTVNRCLGELARQGAIFNGYAELRIMDSEKLQAVITDS